MRDDELGPSNQKRLRESDYEADDKDSDTRSHPNLQDQNNTSSYPKRTMSRTNQRMIRTKTLAAILSSMRTLHSENSKGPMRKLRKAQREKRKASNKHPQRSFWKMKDIPSRRLMRLCMNQTGMWRRIGTS